MGKGNPKKLKRNPKKLKRNPKKLKRNPKKLKRNQNSYAPGSEKKKKLIAAVEYVQRTGCSLRTAEKKFKIPKSTISDYIRRTNANIIRREAVATRTSDNIPASEGTSSNVSDAEGSLSQHPSESHIQSDKIGESEWNVFKGISTFEEEIDLEDIPVIDLGPLKNKHRDIVKYLAMDAGTTDQFVQDLFEDHSRTRFKTMSYTRPKNLPVVSLINDPDLFENDQLHLMED